MNSKELAKKWLNDANRYQSFIDRVIAKSMNRFFQDSEAKVFVIRMLDRAFRPSNSKDVAAIIGSIPSLKFLNLFERFLVLLFNLTRRFCYFFSIPLLKRFIYFTTSRYVLFGSNQKLVARIKSYHQQGLKVNLNRVGELLLGEEEARKRIQQYISDLENPDIDCISIKVSTIYSQINPIAFEQTVADLVERVSIIYRAAKKNSYKVVNFDMEEYRDLSITVEVFMRALDREEFRDLKAGIALQAYIPDSFLYLQKITNWARERVANGASPVRVRIVKGANMDMEIFESQERHWPRATFSSKKQTDANYKRMMRYALQKENITVVNIGAASHNLFEIAYVYSLAKENDVLEYLTFEMISGMSDHVAKMLVHDLKLNILIYLPFGREEDFVGSISYLVRRLDENTARDNYLRYVNSISEGVLTMLEKKFDASMKFKRSLEVHRNQNRLEEKFIDQDYDHAARYIPEADTDFSLEPNHFFAQSTLNKWKNADIPKIPEGKVKEAKEALDCAKNYSEWRDLSDESRFNIIKKVVNNIRRKRGDIAGLMALETGKVFAESDVEISEAVDFGNYYIHSFVKMKNAIKNVQISPKQTVLVLSPWNFPFAIPAGGVFAGLVAGSNVILKPSNLATATGLEIAKCFWEAGVPKEALQFIPSFDSKAAMELSKSSDVDLIVFTGSTQTARAIIKSNPLTEIIAETGGKNVTIATKYSDRDQVIKNVLQSAFSNSGQKCSATSVLALEEEVYEDKEFLERLVDAAKSLKVGLPWDLQVRVNPLIRKPFADLKYALTELEPHESWLLEPQCLNKEKTLWSPAIRIGTRLNDKSHNTEFFGPSLAIMKINSLQEGIDLTNSTGYGLTAGLESLNEAEQEIWKKEIQAGNLYINRSTTGAIVERQPFGGMNNSAFGSGIKAGGLNYIYQFCDFVNIYSGLEFTAITANYKKAYSAYFAKKIDYQKVRGQSNFARFLKVESILIRAENPKDLKDLAVTIFAAKLCSEDVNLSLASSELVKKIRKFSATILRNVKVDVESVESCATRAEGFSRMRFIGDKSAATFLKNELSKTATNVVSKPVIYEGRIELLHYLQEQSISTNYHRFGYVEPKKPNIS